MDTYIVTSERLAGFSRGDVVSVKDLDGANIKALLDSGHIVEHVSAQTVKKSAKTKDIETEKD